MNDIDVIVRETLEIHAGDVSTSRNLVDTAIRRSRTIHRRRVATAGAATAVAVSLAGITLTAALDHQHHDNSRVGVLAGPTPTDSASPSATPSPSPGFASACPAGEAPLLSATGAATNNGKVKAGDNVQSATQALLQSYLLAVSNRTPISDDGVGVDSTTHQKVVWVKFEDTRVIEIVPDGNDGRWTSFRAALGACAPVGS